MGGHEVGGVTLGIGSCSSGGGGSRCAGVLFVIRLYLEGIEGQVARRVIIVELIDAEARTCGGIEELVVGIEAGGEDAVDLRLLSAGEVILPDAALAGCHVGIALADDHHVLAEVFRLVGAFGNPLFRFRVIVLGILFLGEQGDAHVDGVAALHIYDLSFIPVLAQDVCIAIFVNGHVFAAEILVQGLIERHVGIFSRLLIVIIDGGLLRADRAIRALEARYDHQFLVAKGYGVDRRAWEANQFSLGGITQVHTCHHAAFARVHGG